MDSYTKAGKVFLQPHRAGKKWKPVWLSVFPPSGSAVGQLEIQDMGGGGVGGDHGAGVRRHHQPLRDRKAKVVPLSEVISVLRLPPNAEACPMENMSAFCVETQDRTMVFAAPRDDCVDWVEKLCHSTFQRGGGSGPNQLHMEENQIYASADRTSEFWVGVQRTDAAMRCGLQGSYWLQVGQEALLLREPQKKSIVREWPYELLRRYGKDKLALTIEAGRRCDSGPGTFTFETQQANSIFSLIQSTIKQKSSAATSEESAEEESHPPPITLMPLPLVPTHDAPPGGASGRSDAIYADPADCVQPAPKPHTPTALYVDPASVLPLKPPGLREPIVPTPNPRFDVDHPESVYSEVFDKVSPVRGAPPPTQTKRKTTRFADDEPIYTEPVTDSREASHKKEIQPDPFAHLYAQVCKTASASSPSRSLGSAPSLAVTGDTTATKDVDQSLDDVIYENLGII